MGMPLVSVLITVYNDESNVDKALESILNQAYQNFEIIIVNDGSTDNTLSVLAFYQKKDGRIRVINQENCGTANAANNGLKHCTGKYIARLDSDDISYPHRLQEEVAFLEANPNVGLVGGGCLIKSTDERIIGSRNIRTNNPYKTLIKRCIYQQSDVMFRKDILEKLAGNTVYRSKFKGAEDYDLWLRISEVSEIAKINKILGIWTLNAGGYTLARKEEQLEAVKELKKMAVARRRGKKDWYDDFIPKVNDAIHRDQIKEFEYDKIVAQVLLKQIRTKDARKQLAKYKKDKENWRSVKKWVYLTYLPKPVLRLIFNFREFILNNSSIELR